MAGVGEAASVIAVVGFALSSSKIIHDTISGIKDGPKIIVQTTSALGELKKILKLIQALTVRYPLVDAALQTQIQQCNADLKEFKKNIGCLRILATDKRLGKAWKRVKMMLKQDDFQKMWEIINRHISALSLRLQLVGLNTGFAHKEDLHQLNEAQKVITLNTSAESREKFQNQLENITTLSSQQVLNTSTATEAVLRSEATLGRIKEGVEGFGAKSASLHASTRQDIEGLSSRVEKLSNLSEDQSETIQSILERLQCLLNAEAIQKSQDLKVPQMPATSADSGNGRTPDKRVSKEAEEDLSASLQRLRSLAALKERTFFSREAQNIIEDVELLLNAVSLTMETPDCEDSGTRRKRSHDYDLDPDVPADEAAQYKHGIKRIKGVLVTSQCIAVNSQVAPRRLRISGRKYKSTHLNKSHRVGDGTVIVNASRRILKDLIDDADDQRSRSNNGTIEIFEGAIKYLPDSVPNTLLSVSFQQRSTFEGSLLGKPTISFSATLPDDSEVFLRIKDGDMEGLLKLFAEGAAALSDRDSRGRSLLNYACAYLKPTICRFLVEHGADVDAIEDGRHGFPTTMLQTWVSNDFLERSEDIEVCFACSRVLLENGADPTVESDNNHYFGWSSFNDALKIRGVVGDLFWNILSLLRVRKDLLRLYLDLAHDFIDTEERDEWGRSWLLRLLLRTYSPDIYKKVALLLARGADPRSRTNDGWTCLHYCLRNVGISQCLDVLMLLLEAGADPWVMNESVESVTEHAYTTPEEGWWSSTWSTMSHCGNRGMIWEQALTACGFNAAEFRQAYLDAGGRFDLTFRKVRDAQRNQLRIVRIDQDIDLEVESVVSDSNQDSESEGESNLAYTAEADEPTQSGSPGDWVVSSASEKQQRIPMAESWDSHPYSRNSSDAASIQYNNIPMMDIYLADPSPWNWKQSSQTDNEISHDPAPSTLTNQYLRPRTDNTHWSSTSAQYQRESPQTNTLPRIQELDLLEGDANVWGS